MTTYLGGKFCGHPDAFTIGGKWERPNLTWWIDEPSRVIPRFEIAAMKQRNYATIAAVCRLSFSPAPSWSAGVELVSSWFGAGMAHPGSAAGVVDPAFGGPGDELAHAFLPSDRWDHFLEGDTHTDDSEAWDFAPASDEIDPGTVDLHEALHTVGVGHSTDPLSVMYPRYSGVRRALSDDDKSALIALYGERTTGDGRVQLPPHKLWGSATRGSGARIDGELVADGGSVHAYDHDSTLATPIATAIIDGGTWALDVSPDTARRVRFNIQSAGMLTELSDVWDIVYGGFNEIGLDLNVSGATPTPPTPPARPVAGRYEVTLTGFAVPIDGE